MMLDEIRCGYDVTVDVSELGASSRLEFERVLILFDLVERQSRDVQGIAHVCRWREEAVECADELVRSREVDKAIGELCGTERGIRSACGVDHAAFNVLLLVLTSIPTPGH